LSVGDLARPKRRKSFADGTVPELIKSSRLAVDLINRNFAKGESIEPALRVGVVAAEAWRMARVTGTADHCQRILLTRRAPPELHAG